MGFDPLFHDVTKLFFGKPVIDELNGLSKKWVFHCFYFFFKEVDVSSGLVAEFNDVLNRIAIVDVVAQEHFLYGDSTELKYFPDGKANGASGHRAADHDDNSVFVEEDGPIIRRS